MIIVNYRSKRELKKAVGKPLDYEESNPGLQSFKTDGSFFGVNQSRSFQATITMVNGKIESVR